MQVGLCTSLENAEKLDLSCLDFVEATLGDALQPLADDTAFRASLDMAERLSRPVTAANCFIPGDIKSTGPDMDRAVLDRYVRTACERAGAAGVRTIVYGSGGSRAVPEGFPIRDAQDQMVENLKRWGDWAGENSVTIALEPLNASECNIVTSVAEGRALVGRVGHEHIALLADFYHMACDGEPASNIADVPPGMIRHLHIAEKARRTPPGIEGDDFAPYLQALKRIGYEGAISLECSFDDIYAELADSVTFLRARIAEAGL